MTCYQKLLFGVVACCVTLLHASVRAQEYQELYSFGGHGDGANPQGGLVEGPDHCFYGTTYFGGTQDAGTFFKITPAGALTILASFDGTKLSNPVYTLLLASDGNFYGSLWNGAGFRATPMGQLTISLAGSTAGELVQGADGWIYAVLNGDGTFYGWIYRVTLDGQTEQTLHQFTVERSYQDGTDPAGPLIQGPDGNFYGTTAGGGMYSHGTFFRITTNGLFTALAHFNNANCGAASPYGALLLASDGNFYGAAGGCSMGTTFRATPQGTLTTLDMFHCTDGQAPNGGLIEANDGYFYGTAMYGGCDAWADMVGTVFRMAPDGTTTGIFAFTANGGPYPGANPYSGLVQGSDGNLYGTTCNQGTQGFGNVFRIVMPGPLLSSSRVGQQLTFSWRTNYAGFRLQASPTLNPANWADSTDSPAILGSRFFLTNSFSDNARFFRLKR